MKLKNDYSSRFRILKGGKISLVVSAILGGATISFAAPTGGSVTSGTANISQSGTTTNITQSTQKASINWQNFSIGANETVNFKQPNASSITLNRVIGNEKSIIDGALNANGQVWLLNSNGILFNSSAKVNTAGFLATTKNLSDEDFNKGNYNFSGDSSASVINKGTIESVNSSYVVFAANEVKNEGTIKAIKGKIHLVGADEISINLNGNSLLDLTVKKGVLDALVENSGTIYADGGEIYLTTNAVDELLKGVVNNTGVIEANSMDDFNTHVELFAHGGTANISGTITAIDGFVETSANRVKIDDSFRVTADKWLIDPTDFTIAASGGDTTGATISTNLSTADIEIQSVNGASGTAGDIYVNDTITWSSDKKLTLNAQNDIFINKSITATNTAGQLALYYGNSGDYYVNAKVNLSAGDNFFTKQASDGAETTWTVVTTGTDLQGMNERLNGNTVLGTDIVLSGTNNWTPIGNNLVGAFVGNFDGLGHTIDNINISSTNNYLGLFGNTYGATIKNVGVTNIFIYGNSTSMFVGGLVGISYNSTITNSYASGIVHGSTYVGGLVGVNNESSSITNSYASVDVTGSTYVGGLVGDNANISSITTSYANGTVSGSTYVGGLVGDTAGSPINNSFYDNEANTATTMQDKDTYGKTKEEILTAFSNEDGWVTDGATVAGYSTDSFSLPLLKTFYTPTTTLFEGGYGTSTDAYTITNWTQLQNINYASDTTLLSKYYTLSNNIDNTTAGYTNSGTGWTPIGDDSTKFTGTFDGLGHTIDKLTINNTSGANIGLFGYTSAATIKNVGVTNVDITKNSFSLFYLGGLVGYNDNSSSIKNSYATGRVSTYGDSSKVGGLVGFSYDNSNIENSYSLVSVITSGNSNEVGGLVGSNHSSTITNSYASGTVSGTNAGGLVGLNVSSTITNSFYDKDTSGQTAGIGSGASQTGVTGLTTEQISYGKIFKDASWDIVADSSVTSSTPVIKYDSVNSKYVWAIAPLDLHYTLSTNQSKIYDGETKTLSTLFTNVFGSDYDFVTEYKFQRDGSDVTGYRNAGTYDNIKVASNSDFLTIASSGNTDGKYVINKKDIIAQGITAANKIYDGTTTATLDTSSATFTGIVTSDTLTIASSTGIFNSKEVGTGKTVSITDITLGGADKDNYNLTNASTAAANITPKDIIVSADDLEKVYGSQDATLTYTATGLVGTDTLTGSLTRVAGENVGDYTISQDTTLANSNYTVIFENGKYTITPKAITVSADDLEKIYGTADATLTYTAQGLVGTDTLTGSLTRETGENVGDYTISQDTTLANSNYTVTFENGKYTITPKAITVSADDLTKIYGSQDATLTYTATGLVGTDTLTGSLTRETGENVGDYTISQDTTLANSNYTVTFENGKYTITPKAITVSADDLTKIYGSQDAPLTYTAQGLVGTDTLTGSLTRETGENVGEYTISQDTTLANSNYTVSFTNGKYTITPKAITVSADDLEKIYGEDNPTLTFGTDGLIIGDSLNGELSTTATISSEAGTYDITQGTLANSNYAITFNDGTFTITPKATTPTTPPTLEPTPEPEPTTTPTTEIKKEINSIARREIQTQRVDQRVAIPTASPQQTQSQTVTMSTNGQELERVDGFDMENSMVPARQGSMLMVVKGGVNLPIGVPQEYYREIQEEGN